MYIADGESLGKSYEEASLLEDLSADADKAFQLQESRLLSRPNVGFFGANIKTPQDQVQCFAIPQEIGYSAMALGNKIPMLQEEN